MTAYSEPPMALGNAASVHVRLIVWCKNYRRLAQPRLGDLAGSRRPGFDPRATADHRPLCRQRALPRQ
jgi:hypothetical protein